MLNFILVTDEVGKEVLVNLNNVTSIISVGDSKAGIYFNNDVDMLIIDDSINCFFRFFETNKDIINYRIP